MDNYTEQTVRVPMTVGRRLVYLFAILFVIAMGILCLASVYMFLSDSADTFNITMIVMTVITGCAAAAAWYFKDRLRVEYDYLLSDETLTVTAVYSGKSRRHILEFAISDIVAVNGNDAGKVCKCAGTNAGTHIRVRGQNGDHTVILDLNEQMRKELARAMKKKGIYIEGV